MIFRSSTLSYSMYIMGKDISMLHLFGCSPPKYSHFVSLQLIPIELHAKWGHEYYGRLSTSSYMHIVLGK